MVNGMPIDLNTVLMIALFVGNAVIGSVAYIFFHNIRDQNSAVRHIILACIAGYLYWNIHNSYNVPNSFVSMVIGWFAPDFIEAIMEKYKPKAPNVGGGT